MNFRTFQRPLCDRFLLIAEDSGLRTAERLNELESVARQAETITDATEVAAAAPCMDQLRLGAWLACMPSLRASAVGLPQTPETATEVLTNLRGYSKQLIDATSKEFANTRAISDNATGYLGEVGVLGLFWWGLSRNRLAAGGSAYPTLSHLDGATISLSGRDAGRTQKMGHDIMLRDSAGCTQPIQVKNADHHKRFVSKEGRNRKYHRSVAVLHVTELTGAEPGYAPLLLLDALVSNERQFLSSALHVAQEEIRKVKQLIPGSEARVRRSAASR